MSQARARRALIPAFTPTSVPAEDLVARTVGREQVIERLVGRIRSAATDGGRPHALVVGPRGSGKTHLLCVVTDEALQDETVAERVVVVALPEDAPHVTSYEDLLFALVEQLAPASDHAVAALEAAIAARRDGDTLERLLLELVGDRVLVLVLENLDRLFGDFGTAGQRRLRGFVETSRQVLVLASTPLLFEALADHEEPWYGAFHTEHLTDLSMEDGKALLRGLAVASGDGALAEFLDTPAASARLRAVTDLTGGSPRMWTALAGCVTVELLDELVPLVQALLDELVPYYQERLGSLPPNERKLIVELCRTTEVVSGGRIVRRAQGMRTAADLATALGMSAPVVTTSLNRLREKRWVTGSKQPGTDQRTTWFEIREPLLRHHLQYRESRGETLRVIVSFLRDWYSVTEQQRHLAEAEPESIAEEYLRAALLGRRGRDGLFEGSSAERLLSTMRCWIDVPPAQRSREISSRLAGCVGEAAVLAVRDGADAARAAAALRVEASSKRERSQLERVLQAAISETAAEPRSTDPSVADRRIGRALAAAWAAVDAPASYDGVALAFARVAWSYRTEASDSSIEAFEALSAEASRLTDAWPLRTAIEIEWAYALRDDPRAAFPLLERAIEQRTAHLGASYDDTIDNRFTVLCWRVLLKGVAGLPESTTTDLVASYARVYGAASEDAQMASATCAAIDAKLERWASVRTIAGNALEAARVARREVSSEYDVRLRALHAQATGHLGDWRGATERLVALIDGLDRDDEPSVAAVQYALTSVLSAVPVDEVVSIGRAPILHQALHALDRFSFNPIVSWCMESVDLPVEALPAATSAIAWTAENPAALLTALLTACAVAATRPPAQRRAWISVWTAALPDATDGWQDEIHAVLVETVEGEQVSIWKLPEEVRNIMLQVIIDGANVTAALR